MNEKTIHRTEDAISDEAHWHSVRSLARIRLLEWLARNEEPRRPMLSRGRGQSPRLDLCGGLQ
jgi:hypothetical protein